jgi:hypothetical protein
MSSNIYAELYPGREKMHIPNKHIDELVVREEQKITNDIMYHIREFFLISSRRNFTKKSRGKMGKYSRKKHAVSRI